MYKNKIKMMKLKDNFYFCQNVPIEDKKFNLQCHPLLESKELNAIAFLKILTMFLSTFRFLNKMVKKTQSLDVVDILENKIQK